MLEYTKNCAISKFYISMAKRMLQRFRNGLDNIPAVPNLKLTQAQNLIAKNHGFNKWHEFVYSEKNTIYSQFDPEQVKDFIAKLDEHQWNKMTEKMKLSDMIITDNNNTRINSYDMGNVLKFDHKKVMISIVEIVKKLTKKERKLIKKIRNQNSNITKDIIKKMISEKNGFNNWHDMIIDKMMNAGYSNRVEEYKERYVYIRNYKNNQEVRQIIKS